MRVVLIMIIALFATISYGSKKPNIIWLMAEDISLDLECYGTKGVQTPVLNSLADEGTMYNNCFVTNPICSPSRSSMMVGTHQLKIGAQHHRSNRDVILPDPYKPFTYWLRNNGYTAIIGHHGVMAKGRKIDCNFKTEMIGEWDGETKFGLFDKSLNFEKEDQPFFAQIQLVATHRGDWWDSVRSKSDHPVNPDDIELPPHYSDTPTIRLDWAKYLDQMEYIDNEIGLIIEELVEKKMDDNTIIIFIGDNGRCNIWGKGYLHDPGLRIPLIVYDPRDKKGEVSNRIVSSTDITATILDLAGVPIPEYMTGESLLKDGAREEVYSARDLWDEVEDRSRSISTDQWRYIRNDKPQIGWDAQQAYLEFYRPAVHVMRSLKYNANKLDENQQMFFSMQKPKEELYNLKRDPFELNNLATDPQYKEVLEELRDKTVNYDSIMSPVHNIFKPVQPLSVEVLQWVKYTKPELYKDMLNGKEIGFKKLVNEYKSIYR